MAHELPKSVLCSAKQLRPHWDYVLEEMAWLANDFMQVKFLISNFLVSSRSFEFIYVKSACLFR